MRCGLVFLFLVSTMVFGQVKVLDKIDLPDLVEETSGLIYYNHEVITFNDSGGYPELYFINPHTGEINRTVQVTNAINIDWESITQDETAIYVGDTGNNYGNRKDLVIYKIYKSDLSESSNVRAEFIRYSYGDQNSFVAQKHHTNFDCEAITVYKNKILIFTKNWGNQKTNIYTIPKVKGDYIVQKKKQLPINCMLTSIAYNKANDTFMGTAYNKKQKSFLIKITNFDQENEKLKKISLSKVLGLVNQTEAIAWVNPHHIYVSREASKHKIKDKKYKRKQKLISLLLEK